MCVSTNPAHAEATKVADWRMTADARIAEHRMANAEIIVLDAEGQPLADAEVELRMQRHHFQFGTAVNRQRYAQGNPEDRYRERIHSLFNGAVFENGMKWKPWEQANATRMDVDTTIAGLKADNFSLRGHVMIWQCPKFGVTYPLDIQKAIEAGGDEAKAWIRERTEAHIRAVGSYFRGQAQHWDVVNEMCEWTDITRFLTPETPRGKSPDLKRYFEIAHEAAPDALLFINDYHILVGDYTEQKEIYETMIRDLIEHGAPLQAIGFQSHFHGKHLTRTPEQTYATLERYAQFDLPLAVTEYDTFGGGWGDTEEAAEEAEAAFFEEFLVTCFSHPSMEAFYLWGFWDGQHWFDRGPFYRSDWTPKPALEVYERLVFGDWWTESAQAKTSATGRASMRVFYGDYALSIINGDESQQIMLKILPDATRHVVVLD